MIVEDVRRYPVKSMLGERLSRVDVTPAGLAGDRRFALLDRTTGRVVSAKDPRRWRAMLTLRASGAAPDPVRIALPEGRQLSTDGDVDDVLSDLLGAPVTLTATVPAGATLDRARPDEVLAAGIDAVVPVDETPLGGGAPVTFVDFAPVHLVTTATLDRIAADLPGRTVDAARYRPNLVVRTPGDAGFVENDWVGRALRIGPDLVLRVLAPTPRCAVPTLAHGSLPGDPDALRVPARLNRLAPVPQLGPLPCVGVYAQVVQPGPVHVGDAVEVVDAAALT